MTTERHQEEKDWAPGYVVRVFYEPVQEDTFIKRVRIKVSNALGGEVVNEEGISYTEAEELREQTLTDLQGVERNYEVRIDKYSRPEANYG